MHATHAVAFSFRREPQNSHSKGFPVEFGFGFTALSSLSLAWITPIASPAKYSTLNSQGISVNPDGFE